MMAKCAPKDKKNWLRLIEERVEQEKKKKQDALNVPYLPRECVSDILVGLPAESLHSWRFVCKEWYNIINSSLFVHSHFRRSEFVLLFTTPIAPDPLTFLKVSSTRIEKPKTFIVERKILQLDSVPIFNLPNFDVFTKHAIKYLEINKDGESKIGDFNTTCLDSTRIIASCNGLLLLTNWTKKGGLVVLNPVTKNLIALPVGTLSSYYEESYEFVFSNLTSQFKVVHFFGVNSRSIGCEILSVGVGGMWRLVNGLISEFGDFYWFIEKMVNAINALHWIPKVHVRDYLISMEIDDGTLHTIPLPKSCETYDGIVEMKGNLCYLRHEEDFNQIEIWTLKGLHGEKWAKEHQIKVGCLMDMVPFLCSKSGEEILFTRREDGSFYAYNLAEQVMIMIEIPKELSSQLRKSLPHVNSLLTWSANGRTPDALF